jgi:hypothetical protein
MRRSLDGDKDQGAEVATVVRDPGRRARCVPDRPVNAGNSRSLADTPACPLTCAQPGLRLAAHVLLSNRSPVLGAAVIITLGGRHRPRLTGLQPRPIRCQPPADQETMWAGTIVTMVRRSGQRAMYPSTSSGTR